MMIRKFLLNLFLVKLFFLVSHTSLISDDEHESLLSILEKNFPAEITFKQFNDNTEISGWMILKGNGKARTEFSPPNNFLIVADGEWVIFHDPEMNRTTYLPLKTGILQALLDPNAFKKRKEFKVKKSIKNKKLIYSVEFFLENNNQEVLIYFDIENKSLLGWKILENENEHINVQVVSFRKIDSKHLLKDELFTLTNKNIEEGIDFYGPYERAIKKILNNGKLN